MIRKIEGGVVLAPLTADTRRGLREVLPSTATVGNPLDHTTTVWGDTEGVAREARKAAHKGRSLPVRDVTNKLTPALVDFVKQALRSRSMPSAALV